MRGAVGGTFKRIRVGILLTVLVIVAYQSWHDRWASTRWRVPLYIAIYPIAADDSAATAEYVEHLEAERFEDIDAFFVREAKRYHLGLATPLKTRLRARVSDLPPRRDPQAGWLATALFSLELRYWAHRHSGRTADPEDIRMFVLYHDPERTAVVPHSLGLAKGLIGVVYAFATPRMDGANQVVIAHELLHTVGATDKYDFATNGPRFPDGYGDPGQQPLYPQRYAELMAGRRMLDAGRWVQPVSLAEVLIGPATAAEINWPLTPDPPPGSPDAPGSPGSRPELSVSATARGRERCALASQQNSCATVTPRGEAKRDGSSTQQDLHPHG